MDKRRGLIPSAYVDDIKCFTNKQLARISESSNLANLFGFVDEFQTEEDIPGPRHLILDKQLSNSAIISWKHPDTRARMAKEINAFHVYLDGQFRLSVKASEKPRALVEDVESDRPHRISVRSVTNKGQSKDAQCTIEIGRGATPTPGRLKATKITCNSAKLSWLPGNSNYPHIVFLNDVEIKTCDPGIYKFVLTELPPDTVQRICIQAEVKKNIYPEGMSRQAPKCTINQNTKVAFDKSSYAAFIEFRTLHIGLPDPPSRVQVEPGPQDGFLLVTWRPVKINDQYSSNDKTLEKELPVSGYIVAINKRPLKIVEDHKMDHCLLDLDELGSALREVLSNRGQTMEMEEDFNASNPLLTVHSIVKREPNNPEGKLGPCSKPVLLDGKLLLRSAGSYELAASRLGQETCEILSINESEAAKLGIPLMMTAKEESEEKDLESDNVEKSSLTIPAGSVVRQESISKQEEAANNAEKPESEIEAKEEEMDEEKTEPEEKAEEEEVMNPEKVAQLLNEKFDSFANSMKDMFSIKKEAEEEEEKKEEVKEEKNFFEMMQEKINEAAEKIKESAEQTRRDLNLDKDKDKDKEETPVEDPKKESTAEEEIKKEKSFFEMMQEKMDEAAAKIKESAEQTRKDLDKATNELQEKLRPKE